MLEGQCVAVVIPAHNEEPFIRQVVLSIPAFVDHAIVVDDGSDDATLAQVCAELRPGLHCIRHATRRGVGAAILQGYDLALRLGADVVAVMAGDGQMDPDDLRTLLMPALKGEADYVKGNRLAHPEVRRRMPKARWLGNRIFSTLTRWLTGLAIEDSQCGYTAITAKTLRALPLEKIWRSYGYTNSLLGELAFGGFAVREVVVRPRYGEEQSGLRAHHVMVVIPWVLLRIGGRRLRAAFA